MHKLVFYPIQIKLSTRYSAPARKDLSNGVYESSGDGLGDVLTIAIMRLHEIVDAAEYYKDDFRIC